MAFTPNEQGLMVQQFTSNLELVLQQKNSRLIDTVTVVSGLVGTQAQVVRKLGQAEADLVTGRLTEIILNDTETDARYVFPKDYDWNAAADTFELLRTNINPNGEYVMSGAAAMNRAKDKEIISGIFGTNFTGRGTDPVPFDPNQVVPVNTGASAATGMNLEKLIQASEILRANEALDDENDQDLPTVVLSARQISNLQNDERVVSGIYQDQKVLTNGRLTQIFGINIVHSEKLPVDASGYRRNPLYVKSGVILGIWLDMRVSIDRMIKTRGQPYLVYAMQTLGATRTDEKKVVEIKNLEV